ncbi:MAG: two-component system response regulator [Candidatus Muproteobacteria bacterium RIFCSPHIGHO2_01_FULL_65_16]|uniref:Two-component system response regulator n=3 Tax=Candidatus Muproteobacteria TaxID=1817795 RepID=A0A1F6TH65_9PROT|nr:MAG: two-component system response regulator [Candidatus Muproteobacteria bacterium RBG_16_65_31]OGI44710.1 MAG: two-component system response regulator [Candidatus Muproteobacteria bacterium RIFCSPHIGHO2_01_FULL_65_16]OGI52982.1 MAG: two-component system response regulator [Candidatus Muproteobacteria bacterium RIFCSPHIGHO2_02_FULL_65_16]
MAIKNILVIDDSATDAHLLTEMLKKNGYAVTTAASGEEGIAKAKQDKPDLILMDIVMPGMSGFEATRAIAKAADTAAIPVIICSTKGQETDKAWGLRQGARDYLVKPITEKDLIGKIKSL